MSEISDIQSSVEGMKEHVELRGLRPNTISTFSRCARDFLTHFGQGPGRDQRCRCQVSRARPVSMVRLFDTETRTDAGPNAGPTGADEPSDTDT